MAICFATQGAALSFVSLLVTTVTHRVVEMPAGARTIAGRPSAAVTADTAILNRGIVRRLCTKMSTGFSYLDWVTLNMWVTVLLKLHNTFSQKSALPGISNHSSESLPMLDSGKTSGSLCHSCHKPASYCHHQVACQEIIAISNAYFYFLSK